ncbi:hypothetical protein CWC16_00370 [Pseudoalteromonas sp. S3776]|nr:hypothetical protein CWC16_00370 [Pseudoalteromonas sp. S3776]
MRRVNAKFILISLATIHQYKTIIGSVQQSMISYSGHKSVLKSFLSIKLWPSLQHKKFKKTLILNVLNLSCNLAYVVQKFRV